MRFALYLVAGLFVASSMRAAMFLAKALRLP
jgi:hypothetical protein